MPTAQGPDLQAQLREQAVRLRQAQREREIAQEKAQKTLAKIRKKQKKQASSPKIESSILSSDDFRSMLEDPVAIRKAIVLQEILKPPVGLSGYEGPPASQQQR